VSVCARVVRQEGADWGPTEGWRRDWRAAGRCKGTGRSLLSMSVTGMRSMSQAGLQHLLYISSYRFLRSQFDLLLLVLVALFFFFFGQACNSSQRH
jgi:hypothetical protein